MTSKIKPANLLTIGLLMILLVGGVLRLTKLGTLPPGLYQDEAFNGMDALAILDGEPALYFPENNGREPLFIYVMAGTVALFGRTPLGVRAAAAFFGLLTIPASYWLGQTWHSKRAGLLTAAILAGMLWHVQLSRVGFRAVALPFFIALALSLAAWGFAQRNRWTLVAAGIAYGLSFYTYLAAQISLLAVGGMLLYAITWQREWLNEHKGLLLWTIGAAALTLIPLVGLFLAQPDLLTSRAGQVAVWQTANASTVPAVLVNTLRTLGMFIWQGDANWRHNLPSRPVFDPMMAAIFVAGVVWGIVRWRKRPALAMSLIWAGMMLLPTALADDAPHFLRAVGVLPVAALIPALILDEIIVWLADRGTPEAWTGVVGAVALVALSAGLTARAYFDRYASAPEPALAFQGQAVVLASALNKAEEPVRVTGRLWDTFRSIRFLSPTKRNVRYYTDGEILDPLDPPFTLYAWPYDGLTEALNIIPEEVQVAVEAGPESRNDDETDTYPVWVVWKVEAVDNAPVEPVAQFEPAGVDLVSAEATPSDEWIEVMLAWRISGVLPESLPKMFVHVLGPDGTLISQQDALPGGMFYPPTQWTTGSVVMQTVQLTVPVQVDFMVTAGLYNPEDGNRYLPVTNLPVINSSVILLP